MKKLMEVNKETAQRLWVEQFGKKQKAVDFAGREIAKAAYNDRNSTFGWNVDHILPESRGGKTADHNLICCHILTNDEKAGKFPCFTANGKVFEIQKKQNHYEIIKKRNKNEHSPDDNENDESVNFLDSAQGLRLWKSFNEAHDNNRDKVFVGYVKIDLAIPSDNKNIASQFEDFLIELFETKCVFAKDNGAFSSYNWGGSHYFNKFCFTVIVYDVSTTDCIENLLNNCITLNTYRNYFTSKKIFDNMRIICGVECYKSNFEMSLNIQSDIINKDFNYMDGLAINTLVKINTSAKDKLSGETSRNNLYDYNYVFAKLNADLLK